MTREEQPRLFLWLVLQAHLLSYYPLPCFEPRLIGIEPLAHLLLGSL